MSLRGWSFSFLLLALTAQAAELKIRVVDPQSAVVAGARVVLYRAGEAVPLSLQTTAGDGSASFTAIAPANYRVQVLAPGFKPQSRDLAVPEESSVTLRLSLATAAETVVVSAERLPLPTDEAGAETGILNSTDLTAMQPVDALEALRFLPGVATSTSGRRGGLGSIFVRGGDSRYNKVIIDGMAVNDPGGTFDFGVVPMYQVERVEFVRGAQSTLYGSDAMTSVIEMWSRTGATRVPELRFGAEGGTFKTARGSASLAGARGRLDYDVFSEQFNTQGQGPNDAYSNSLQGGNIGIALSRHALFRLRARHANSYSGVQSFWNFNGQPLVPPDTDQHARQNNFLASGELSMAAPGRWQHRIAGFEYHHRRSVVDSVMDPGRVSPALVSPFNPTGNFDFSFSDFANINRAGLEYQGEYWARSWARTVFGYHFEDENGFVGDLTSPPLSHGLRRNHAVFGQEMLTWKRISLIGGVRFVHNESFGNKAVPRVAAGVLARKGGDIVSGTRLRFACGTGIKEPRLEESFGIGGFGIVPNSKLKAEENRSLETGVEQNFGGGKARVSATYFNNLFTNQIAFSFDPATFVSQYINVNRALAHGAELELRARPWNRWSLDGAYTYTSTQVLKAPLAFDPLLAAGAPLLRRPRHGGTLLLTYATPRWGANLGGVFVGRRPDSDFLGLVPPVRHAAGYARLDLGAWRELTRHVTAYFKLENLLNRKYEEAAGYPALKANFRAGMRFRLGGE